MQNPSHSYNDRGVYKVKLFVTDECETDSVEKKITIKESPFIDLGPDTSICKESPLALNAYYAEAVYQWSTGATEKSIIVTDSGIYSVKIMLTNGCEAKDSVKVNSTICEQLLKDSLEEPSNIFTPNGDGNNDIFSIKNNGFKSINLIIFNRWGQEVFQTNISQIYWDGSSDQSGKMADAGVYYYILKGEYLSGNKISKNGFVVLIR